MSFTAIRQINNDSKINNLEVFAPSTSAIFLDSMEHRGTNMVIPWCTSQAELDNGEVVLIQSLGFFIGFLWQFRDMVRFVATHGALRPDRSHMWSPDAPCVYSNCVTGGNRLLIIRGDQVANATVEITTLP